MSLGNHPTNVPFAPFSRSEKVGRIADWTRNYNAAARPKNPADSVFDFALDDPSLAADDDASFRLVDGKPPPRPKFGPRWRFQQHQPQLPQRRDEEVEAKKREAEKERARRDRLYFQNRSGGNQQQRREAAVLKSSVDIQPEWTMLDQIPFSTFSKLSFAAPEPDDLLVCGAVEFYDRAYDRITPKAETLLERVKNKYFFKPDRRTEELPNDEAKELPNGQADDINLDAEMLAVGEVCGNGEIAVPDKLNKIVKSSESLNVKIEKAMLEKKEEVKEEFERVNAMLVDKEQVQKKLDEVKMVVNELELENISWKPNPPAASKKK